ncbi:MAG TPA: hypothetical protein VH088_23880 [Terriglobales bacterium]|jgi:hypothetical protein|nr:hypothetical protein [Terriglobales bacterium]
MAGFIEVHPRNAFQGLLLVNVDDIKYVYQLAGEGNEKWTVMRFQGADLKPIDVEESYEEVKRLIAQATGGIAPSSVGLRMIPTPARVSLSGTAQ